MTDAAPMIGEPTAKECVDGLRALGLTVCLAASGEVVLLGEEKRLIVAAWSWLTRREAEIAAHLARET